MHEGRNECPPPRIPDVELGQVIWVSQTAKMDILIVGYRSDVRGAGIADGGGRDSG